MSKETFGNMNSEKLNFILAICAILISLASFYATYLQADAAERQVKAETWPWLEFNHGNYDPINKTKSITISVNNSGAGPALIKTMRYEYKNQPYKTIFAFLKACCFSQQEYYEHLKEALEKHHAEARLLDEARLLTSTTSNKIIIPGGKINVLALNKNDWNKEQWEKLNKERWHLKISACYCSLLDKCYQTNNQSKVIEVDSCI